MGGEGRTGDTPSERGVTLQRPRSLSCALTHGMCQVYDVSHFLKEHPGGAAIVMPHLGTDIDDVFEDDDLHMHSRAAHAMLLRFQIGVLAGAHSAERKRDGDGGRLYIDWSKPIVCQIGQLGERYNEFIHSPQVLDGPARFFQSNLLEALSRTPWVRRAHRMGACDCRYAALRQHARCGAAQRACHLLLRPGALDPDRYVQYVCSVIQIQEAVRGRPSDARPMPSFTRVLE